MYTSHLGRYFYSDEFSSCLNAQRSLRHYVFQPVHIDTKHFLVILTLFDVYEMMFMNG